MRVSLTRVWVIILIVMAMMAVSGCLGNRNWQYPPSDAGTYLGNQAPSAVAARAIVLPLEDLRGRGIKEEYWKATIPISPAYGDTIYERPEVAENPEEVDIVRFDPSKDFAKAIAAELAQSGIYSSVKYAEDIQQEPADVAFRGRLRSTAWKRRLYTYGFGPLGTLFWFFGAPMSKTTTGLELDLRLTPLNDPTKVLWSMTMEAENQQLDSPYYLFEDAVESYPVAIQDALKPAIADLIGLANEDPNRLLPR